MTLHNLFFLLGVFFALNLVSLVWSIFIFIRWRRLNLILEGICHQAMSLRGRPLAHIIIERYGGLATIEFDKDSPKRFFTRR